MIHDSCAASRRWTAAHWSRGVAVRPGRQMSLSSSITGRLVISPRRTARADLPAAPGPVITLVSHLTMMPIPRDRLGQVRAVCKAGSLHRSAAAVAYNASQGPDGHESLSTKSASSSCLSDPCLSPSRIPLSWATPLLLTRSEPPTSTTRLNARSAQFWL
jgi:hypothetical protein